MQEIITPVKEKIIEKEEGEPTILGEYEHWKNVPPNIKIKKPLSIEEIAQQEGCETSVLEADIKSKVGKFAAAMKEECSYPSEEYADLVDSLYNLYSQAKNSEAIKENPWLENFQSFEVFADHFCPEATPHSRSFMKRNIQAFVEKIVNDGKLITCHPRAWYGVDKAGVRETYNNKCDWVLLPDEYYREGFSEFTDKSVVAEVVELVNSKYRYSDFSHATGSAALPGIEKNGAILSAREAKKAGLPVRTGEHVSYLNSSNDIPVTGGRDGLSSIYACKDGVEYGYHHLNWFDEYPVAFGINQKKQEDFLRQSGFNYEFIIGEGSPILTVDLGSEGVIIGNKAPLANVEIVYCWKKYQKEMEAWMQKNCPQAKFVSLEADKVLRTHGHDINRLALEEKISVEDAWKKLLAKA